MSEAKQKEEESTLNLAGRKLLAVERHVAVAHKLAGTLDLTMNRVRNCEALRHMEKLRCLILDKNSIEDLASINFPVMPTVDTLWLNDNELGDLNATMDVISTKFPNLTYLSMLKNPACPNMYFSDGEAEAYQRYRYYVIHRLSKLTYLDSTPVTDEERAEAERRGKFLKVMKPDESQYNRNAPENEEHEQVVATVGGVGAGPAEAYNSNSQQPAAFLARGRMRYDGSHSEGNRFISNDDL
eukprot:TRINITY_DN65703_c4_g14_i1.p1 TRINITY_DN65703_c4_g14~~TRINITY_DN65703_c4_g14_i1.p1  ORF type:complete len:256 (+),score=121.86 TRINITY_DN65703_c4_g14_i1:48-770(+)